MYKNFFGFIERPFRLVPNPDYLFLSGAHEEALAHLTYSISQGDGFVELTGEVGSGKTTLCRVLLESLDTDTEAAFIFNPKLDSIQLLKAINDEFGISSEADNTKELIDALNFFLLRKKSQGRKVILLIDEAQNLSLEVLEQIRLLSNLETTTSKLLQIILVGQPELSEMLDSHELRQLSQRITLSYHISPMSLKETRNYIQHRIQIASKKPNVEFTRASYKLIYKYSGGVPRLINIVCDRALLTAYGLNRKTVDGAVTRSAIKEISSRGDIKNDSAGLLTDGKPALILILLACVLTALVFNYSNPFLKDGAEQAARIVSKSGTVTEKQKSAARTGSGSEDEPSQSPNTPSDALQSPNPAGADEIVQPGSASIQGKAAGSSDKKESPAAKQEGRTVLTVADYIETADTRRSKRNALEAVVALWTDSHAGKRPYLQDVKDTEDYFRLGLGQFGLSLYPFRGGLKEIENIDLPAVLELVVPEEDRTAYLTLESVSNGVYTFAGDSETIVQSDLKGVQRYFFKRAYIPWKNYYSIKGTIPREITDESILSLKTLLKDIGHEEIDLIPEYDERTRKTIETVQEKNGVKVDGIVGPLTKIILYNEIESLPIPKLSEHKHAL